MNVFDASALLAYLGGEAGADLVSKRLAEGGSCGAANWSEVAQKVRQADGNWDLAKGLLASYDLAIEPVGAEDAERSAELWVAGEGLSLADRLCLALGERLDATIWTADQAWAERRGVEMIR